MHIEILVEEESAERALANIVPSVLGPSVTFRIHVHQGSRGLLQNLPARLKGYSEWLPHDWRIVVLIDEDRRRCYELKRQLERAAHAAGLVTRSVAAETGAQRFHVVNRVAVEELEAWFFGDVEALRAAYPRVPATLDKQARYRDPDAIKGGTWEALERVLQRAGYHRGGLPKIAAARAISQHMEPARNQSSSFRVFVRGLQEAAGL